MPGADHTYFCTCVIHPSGHNVRKTSRMIHNLEIKNHKDTTPAAHSTDVNELNSPSSSNVGGNSDNESLSGILAALSLSDDQSNAIHTIAPNKIPMDAVQMSVQKLLESRFQKPVHHKSPEKSLPPAISMSRKDLPRSAHERKHFLLLDSIERDVREITDLLDVNGANLSEEELRTLLDGVADRIRAIGFNLADDFKTPSAAISGRKQKILETLRSADSRISQLGAHLPELDSVIPVHVDSGKLFENPVASLDTIAQVTLLLGTVAYLVMGLSGESCDFIISVVSMIVQQLTIVLLRKQSIQAIVPTKYSQKMVA
ncbi:hypothetical protein HYPSUDRAFT_58174 [Hypholoma sublateritium FD-334 SS-4]|uniref:Uncharacterized protein n=1 Tax=Hypholoma sublateritium (strain FD-334 SS-4) TaxID=945553 RepID=A0A0D2KPL8_HYPSF|nr:hypothetical protein HYPSUDRAFT_58174 [Hypholoma sublateritium FD-334 SS-4]